MSRGTGSCLRGDHATAIQTLTTWDRRLTERQDLEHWFEVRLRLIAAYRLAGDENRGDGPGDGNWRQRPARRATG